MLHQQRACKKGGILIFSSSKNHRQLQQTVGTIYSTVDSPVLDLKTEEDLDRSL